MEYPKKIASRVWALTLDLEQSLASWQKLIKVSALLSPLEELEFEKLKYSIWRGGGAAARCVGALGNPDSISLHPLNPRYNWCGDFLEETHWQATLGKSSQACASNKGQGTSYHCQRQVRGDSMTSHSEGHSPCLTSKKKRMLPAVCFVNSQKSQEDKAT